MSRLQRVALWAWVLLPSTAGAHGIHTTTLDGDVPHEGVMFDVVALADLDMNALGVNLPTQGTHLVDLWMRKGTHRGHETDPSAWTFVGGAVVETQGAGIAARIMPARMPQRIITGRIHGPCIFMVSSATAVPPSAPATYWPSAPMFQTLAR